MTRERADSTTQQSAEVPAPLLPAGPPPGGGVPRSGSPTLGGGVGAAPQLRRRHTPWCTHSTAGTNLRYKLPFTAGGAGNPATRPEELAGSLPAASSAHALWCAPEKLHTTTNTVGFEPAARKGVPAGWPWPVPQGKAGKALPDSPSSKGTPPGRCGWRRLTATPGGRLCCCPAAPSPRAPAPGGCLSRPWPAGS